MKRAKRIDDTKAFEKALAAQVSAERYLLRLYVSGSTPRSVRAIKNIRALCEDKLQGRYDLEVIDIYQQPEQIKPDEIIVTPTLVKKLPLPFRRIIGDLSAKERVLIALDLIPQNLPVKPREAGHGA